jgi:hypothetical protein
MKYLSEYMSKTINDENRIQDDHFNRMDLMTNSFWNWIPCKILNATKLKHPEQYGWNTMLQVIYIFLFLFDNNQSEYSPTQDWSKLL